MPGRERDLKEKEQDAVLHPSSSSSVWVGVAREKENMQDRPLTPKKKKKKKKTQKKKKKNRAHKINLIISRMFECGK